MIMENEPSSRQDHFSAAIGGKLYVFGGRRKVNVSNEKSVHWFDMSKETWQPREVEPPPFSELHAGACTSSEHHLYLYGGEDKISFKNFLYQLDTNLLTWMQLHPPLESGAANGPMKKVGCRLVFYKDKEIVLFGGAEFIEHVKYSTGSRTNKFSDGRGWTNELHTFDVEKGDLQNSLW